MQLNLEGKKALLFDCDGTLADTMEAHKMAYKLAFALNKVPFFPGIFDRFAPSGGRILIKRMVTDIGYDGKEESIIRDKQRLLPYCLEKYMKPNHELIKLINEQYGKLKIAVVSNGRLNSISRIIEELGILDKLEYLTTSDILGTPKPSPEAYLYTMMILRVKPEEVIVFEDNEIGITSARDAGIKDIVEVKI
jgi:HAD superfamily hydrolase (TIGR01509 family)